LPTKVSPSLSNVKRVFAALSIPFTPLCDIRECHPPTLPRR
jgi:hypothetical protein